MAANCTACGRELRAGVRFCPACGQAASGVGAETATGAPGRPAVLVAPGPALPVGPPARRPPSGHRALFAGAATLAVGAAAVIGIVLGTHASPSVPPTVSTQFGAGLTSPTSGPGPTATGGPTVTAPPAAGPSGRLYAITQDVVVRDGPSTSATRIGFIPSGTMIGVQCKTSGEVVTGTWGPDPWWDRVAYNGVGGYVTDEWVDTRSDEADPTMVPLC